MADSQQDERRDPHNWNPLENYLFLHEKHLEEHPLVLPGSELEIHIILVPGALYDTIIVEGTIFCANGLTLEVYKSGEIGRTSARRVRMRLYSYNAWRPNGHNVLRYDNLHRGDHDTYHKHVFDPATGDLQELITMSRRKFPVMHQILDELMEMFPADG